jgi:hypothetical protein
MIYENVLQWFTRIHAFGIDLLESICIGKSRIFSRKVARAPRLPWFELVTSPSREASSTTTPHTHMRPYAFLILLILYYTEYKSVFWGTKRIQI